ncbi:MAG TPA: DUF2254 family protein [Solirubrobacteraceae bacterium]
MNRARASTAGATRPSALFRLRLWLSTALWAPVLAANLLAIALAIVLPLVDERLTRNHLPVALSSAQQLFGALAAGMITFTGITFSAVFVAAQIQTSSYSPRLAARLRREPAVGISLALSTATASYALFALASLGRRDLSRGGRDFVPEITVLVGLVLAAVTLGAFVLLVQRMFLMIQIGGILRDLMRRAHAVIDDVHPLRAGADTTVERPHGAHEIVRELRHEGAPGVVAAVDRAALLRLAAESGGFVGVVPSVGQFVAPGDAVLRLTGDAAHRPGFPPHDASAVLVLARQRTIDQDPAFAFRMLVDIAIRALSPAVNDPTTAVQVLDRLELLLVDLLHRQTGPGYVVDGDGVPRGLVPAPGWLDYYELAVSEIRRYGAGSLQVARRLRALHEHLLALAEPGDRARVALELRLLDADVAAAFPDAEERALALRADRLGLGGPS